MLADRAAYPGRSRAHSGFTKRGGNARHVTLDEALNKLARVDARKTRLVELRYFGGSHEEAAALLGVSANTAKREWRLARALRRRRPDSNGLTYIRDGYSIEIWRRRPRRKPR